MAGRPKQDVITFKVDPSLRDALAGIANRSEFIRGAILAALDSICPLCKGSGILTPDQKRHWQNFARDHSLQQCADCRATYLVCGVNSAALPSHANQPDHPEAAR